MHELPHSVPPTLQQATVFPQLHQKLLDTHRQVWACLLCGHCSFLVGPGAQDFVSVLQESVSPVLCKFWWLCGGVNGGLLQEGLWHTQVCCTQRPYSSGRPLLTITSAGDTQTLVWLSLCGVPWCMQHFVWVLWAALVGVGFDSKHDFFPTTIFLGLLLCPWTWGIIFGGIQHSPVDGFSAASCDFGVLAGEDECTSSYSAINRTFFIFFSVYFFSFTVGLYWSLESRLCLCFDQRNSIEMMSELWGLAIGGFYSSSFNCLESCFALQFEEAHIAIN